MFFTVGIFNKNDGIGWIRKIYIWKCHFLKIFETWYECKKSDHMLQIAVRILNKIVRYNVYSGYEIWMNFVLFFNQAPNIKNNSKPMAHLVSSSLHVNIQAKEVSQKWILNFFHYSLSVGGLKSRKMEIHSERILAASICPSERRNLGG